MADGEVPAPTVPAGASWPALEAWQTRETRAQARTPLSDPRLSILDSLDQMLFIFDVDEWRMRWGNRAALQFWNAGDLASFVLHDFPASARLREINHQVRERFQQERFVRMESTVYPDARGPVRLALSYSPYRLPDGRVALLVEASPLRVTDPEAMRRMDAARYAPLVMTTHAADGLTLAVNALARSTFGNSFDLATLFERPERGRRVLDCLARGEEISEDAELRTLQGSRWYAIEARQVRDPVTELPAILLCAHDISARRDAERAKDELLSVVSHELRTPLASIRGSLDLIAGGVLADDAAIQHEMLEIARANVLRLGQTVDDLLDVQRLAAGAVELSPSPADLGQLTRTCVELQQPAARVRGVTLTCAGDVELPCHVDEARIQQVVANLLSNALKHSCAGQVVEIEVGRAGPRARVSVTDQGSGVPAGFHGKMFKPFSQADASDQRRTGGAGLGLYIARRLIERHGGEIGFDPTVTRGARFYFELPLLTPSCAPPPAPT